MASNFAVMLYKDTRNIWRRTPHSPQRLILVQTRREKYLSFSLFTLTVIEAIAYK